MADAVRGFLAVVALGGAWTSVGCEGRYANLGEPSRPDPSLDTQSTATWLGDDGTFVWVLIAGQEDIEGRAGAVLARISRDTTTMIEAGSYQANVDAGRLVLSSNVRLIREAGLDQTFVGREGAVAETLVPPLERFFELTVPEPDDPTELGLRSEAGLDVRLIDVGLAAGGLDPADARTVPELFRMVMLPVLLMQARVPFFGGRRVTNLVREGPFDTSGLVGGRFRTTVDDVVAPNVEIAPEDVVELTGLVVGGRYVQATDLAGNGALDGRLDFRLEGRGATILDGRLSFTGVEMVRGVPARGSYNFSVDGNGWNVGAGLLLNFDLSAVLLPSETDP